MIKRCLQTGALALLIAGCEQQSPTPQNPDNPPSKPEGGGIKIRAPGVKVDIQKDHDKKVDVDVRTDH